VEPEAKIEVDTESAAPPVLSAMDKRASERIETEPIKIVEENHKKNYVRIFIYEVSNSFFYGYQLKVNRIIRQKKPTWADVPWMSIEAARLAAKAEIIKICKNNKMIRELFEDFTIIKYNQMELF